MVKLYDKENDALLGEITDEQLQFLKDQLEEESLEDADYYLNQATLDMFADRGADAELLDLLHRALAGRQEIDIVLSEE